jgi:hypothetical protein
LRYEGESVTWRGIDDPTADLDDLIEAYFADEKILAADLPRVGPFPVGGLPGYDGRLFDWLTEMTNYGPADGPERAWPVVLELIARAPDEDALTFVGCGAVEDLVNKHGASFGERIRSQATLDPRFRRALGHVWPYDDVPSYLLKLIVESRNEGGQ